MLLLGQVRESRRTNVLREADTGKDAGAMVESISAFPMFPEALHTTLTYLDIDKPK